MKEKRERKKACLCSFLWRGRHFFCFFQIAFAARPWKLAPAQVMVDRSAFVKMLLKSRADSTVKKYLVEIRRFLAGCRQNSVADSYPFSPTVVTLYLFQLFAHQHKSYSVLVMVHAALKWFHSFVPINGPNPLDARVPRMLSSRQRGGKATPFRKRRRSARSSSRK